jgi:hypothetical protein
MSHKKNKVSSLVYITLILSIVVWGASHMPQVMNSNMIALVLPQALVDYTNQDRAFKTLPSVNTHPLLERAALLKAQDMANKGYFAHTSPDGHDPWYWLDSVGYDFRYAGENLAINFSESSDVNTAWVNSPGHYANIVNGKFTEVGIATAEGFYGGKQTTFVVQFFGTPAKKKTVSFTETSKKQLLSRTTNVQTGSSTVPVVLGAFAEYSFIETERDKTLFHINTLYDRLVYVYIIHNNI